MIKPFHKFNNGNGATLCHNCSSIISIGHTDDLFCENCEEYFKIQYSGKFNSMSELYLLIEKDFK